MNRKIKFRVWDNYEKKFLSLEDYQDLGAIEVENDGTLTLSPRYRFLTSMMIMPERFIPLQYTGLKDKNGKKIFEGDIVRVNEYYKGIGETDLLYKVEYIDRLYKYAFNPIIVNGKYDNNNHDIDLYIYEANNIEVIGNIYENNLESEVN